MFAILQCERILVPTSAQELERSKNVDVLLQNAIFDRFLGFYRNTRAFLRSHKMELELNSRAGGRVLTAATLFSVVSLLHVVLTGST
jgi:hypothetical protein